MNSDHSIPIRRSMFTLKRPVTLIKNHKNSERPADWVNPNKGVIPNQMLWEKRLNSTNELFERDKDKPVPLSSRLSGNGLSNTEMDGVYLSLVSTLHQFWQSRAIVGQYRDKDDVIDRNQPLMECIIVSESDISQQNDVVNQLRSQLSKEIDKLKAIENESSRTID